MHQRTDIYPEQNENTKYGNRVYNSARQRASHLENKRHQPISTGRWRCVFITATRNERADLELRLNHIDPFALAWYVRASNSS
jgi:hypothetical protein